MARSAKNKVIKVITYILLVAVLIGVIGFVAFLTNGFKSEVSDFCVTVNEKIYKTDNISELTLPTDTDVKFSCSYLLSNKETTFSVKVLPNTNAADWDFYVNERVYSFCAESEYTKGFNIVTVSDCFMVNIPSDYSILDILQKNYEGQTISLDESIDTLNTSYFVLCVSSNDVKSTVKIPIKFASNIGVTRVELDKGELLLC